MKKIILVTFMLITFNLFAGQADLDNQIVFYLDMEVNEGTSDNNLTALVNDLVKTVKETEPETSGYQYFISPDQQKVSLVEIYESADAALFHVESFLSSSHKDEFLNTFTITNFQVLGNSTEQLKIAMQDFTNDHRSLIDGY